MFEFNPVRTGWSPWNSDGSHPFWYNVYLLFKEEEKIKMTTTLIGGQTPM